MKFSSNIIDADIDPILENTMIFHIKSEDHTLGNMLAEKIREFLDNSASSLNNFVAYQKDHPLSNVLILKIKIDPSSTSLTHIKIFQMCIDELLSQFEFLLKNWHSSSKTEFKPHVRQKLSKKISPVRKKKLDNSA